LDRCRKNFRHSSTIRKEERKPITTADAALSERTGHALDATVKLSKIQRFIAYQKSWSLGIIPDGSIH
jgi:hypothetical protein